MKARLLSSIVAQNVAALSRLLRFPSNHFRRVFGTPSILADWRDAVTPQHGGDHSSKRDNITLDGRGTSKSYTLSRRQYPEREVSKQHWNASPERRSPHNADRRRGA